ncbi:MAG: flagellin [Campylobacterales bacterium]|nr:flagellin [Campylobacterales bacterium]
MGFRINTNIAALNAHSSAMMNNRNIDSSLSKLSSGLRINNAADDASGLVIADSLRSQGNSLGQAISNGNDAIGLIQTADGALNEYSKILDTIKTKAVQAGSDGQNTTSRLAIQKDISALMKALSNIASTTSFNGQKLLSGTFANKEFQVGASANETIKMSVASAETSQIGQTTRANLTIGQMGENQLTLTSASTGKSLTLESVNIQANNNPANGMGALANSINKYSGDTGISAKAIVTTTTAAPISAGTTGADFAINGITIGSVNTSANDSEGTLMNAINAQSTKTGVTATKTEDGKITLNSADGRAISVSGDMSGVMGTTADAMSTIGHLEVVQAGSSTFQIKGADLGTAVGEDTTITGSMVTVQDSSLAIGSIIVSDSQLAAGTALGAAFSSTEAQALFSSTQDGTLAVGSVIGSGSTLNKDTTLASKILTRETAVLSSDMLIKAGSTLGSNTVFDAGTVLQQDITVANVAYKAGSVLAVDLTLTSSITLSKDMTMSVDIQNPGAAVASGSTLLAGTVLGNDIVTTGTSTLQTSMTIKAGTSLL